MGLPFARSAADTCVAAATKGVPDEMLSIVSDRNTVLARAAGWQTAIEARDIEGIGDYLHQDYALVLVVPRPVTVLRDEWLRLLPDYLVHGYEVHEQNVHVAADTAAMLTLATQHATVLGTDRSGRFVLSDVWLRDGNGAWRVWRRHSTPASAEEMPRA
jgi:ketosteroid isomerase-like protein